MSAGPHPAPGSNRTLSVFRSAGDAADWLEKAAIREGALREGEVVPDFELINATGNVVGVQTLLDHGPVVIVFTLGCRSALCRCSLCALQGRLTEITALGASLVALTPDPPAVSRTLVRKLALGFELLDDRTGRLAALFGIAYRPPIAMDDWLALLGLEGPAAWPPRDVPVPAAFVVTSDGVVRLAHVRSDPRPRVSPTDVLEILATLSRGPFPSAW